MLKKIMLCASLLAITAQASSLTELLSKIEEERKLQKPLTELFYAVQYGQTEDVVDLLAQRPDIINKSYGGETALYLAVRKGNKDCVEELVKHGAKVDSKVLLDAICGKKREIVECLLSKLGKNSPIINTPGEYEWTALSLAAYKGKKDFVEELLNYGAEINGKALVEAVQSKNPNIDILRCLLNKLDKNSPIINERENERTALYWAACRGNKDFVEELLNYGAEVDSKALVEAVQSENPNVDILRCLLNKLGKNSPIINTPGEYGRTALPLAAYKGKKDFVEELLNYGAEVDSKALVEAVQSKTPNLDILRCLLNKLDKNSPIINSENGRTALYWAVRKGNKDFVEELVKHGAEVNGEALIGAVRSENPNLEIVKCLLDNLGENSHRINESENELTALSWATYNGNKDFVEELLNYGANVDSKALVEAVQSENPNVDILRCLLNKLGKNSPIINERENGRTALYWATYKGNKDFVEELLNYGAEADSKVLFDAVKSETPNLDILRCLLNKLDKNSPIINTPDNDGETALSIAVSNGNAGLVNLLVGKGAQVDLKALMTAITRYTPNLDIVNCLLDKSSAIINTKSDKGWTVLSRAAYEGKTKVVKLLIEKGVAVDIEALLMAITSDKSNREIVECLLNKNSAIINTKSNKGWTALSMAAYKGKKDLVELFFDQGAEVNSDAFVGGVKSKSPNRDIMEYLLDKNSAIINEKDSYERTALLVAAHKGDIDLVNWLFEKGANVDPKALFEAVKCGFGDIVKLLLEKDKNLIDAENDGKTLLQVAEESGTPELVDFLKNFKQ